MTTKATEAQLAALHGAVAKVLTDQVTHQEDEVMFDGEEEKLTGQKVYTASPATLSVAIKFLKDNEVTADKELDENMNGLKDALAKKQKRSRLGSAVDAANSTH